MKEVVKSDMDVAEVETDQLVRQVLVRAAGIRSIKKTLISPCACDMMRERRAVDLGLAIDASYDAEVAAGSLARAIAFLSPIAGDSLLG